MTSPLSPSQQQGIAKGEQVSLPMDPKDMWPWEKFSKAQRDAMTKGGHAALGGQVFVLLNGHAVRVGSATYNAGMAQRAANKPPAAGPGLPGKGWIGTRWGDRQRRRHPVQPRRHPRQRAHHRAAGQSPGDTAWC